MGLFKISSGWDVVWIVAFLLSITVILFKNQIAGFIERLGFLNWIDTLFLSKENKKYFDNVKRILLDTSDAKLELATSRILEEYGRTYQGECIKPAKEVLSMLPAGIGSFWEKFDYLDFANDEEIKMLDVKDFKEMKIGESIFYVIGSDGYDSATFLVKRNSEKDRLVYGYWEESDDNPGEDLLEEAFPSFEKWICYYYSVESERELEL